MKAKQTAAAPPVTNLRRETAVFAVIALVIAAGIVFWFVGAPGYTDAYYHFNAAKRWALGFGLTDTYLWTYIGAPGSLPAPSHLYWMPITSLLAGASMWLTGSTSYTSAQIPFALCLAGTALVTFRLGWRVLKQRRGAWIAGLLTLFSGFFTRYWGQIDTFAPYALIGSLGLYALGVAMETPTSRRWWLIAGALAALAHLTRADGLLLLGLGGLLALWLIIERRLTLAAGVGRGGLVLIAYLTVMAPWFARNWIAIGTPLPLGGTQAIWFDEYDDLFNYPPDASPATLSLDEFINSRREALVNNVATFVAVEGLIAMPPFMLLALWRRRHEPAWRPFWVYALGLHLAMTLVFPYPGYRGGLFHSAAALIPFWAVLGLAGIDDAVTWVAKHRRRWQPQVAKALFSFGLLGLALVLSLQTGLAGRSVAIDTIPGLYQELQQHIPADARVLINDPAALYYFTGQSGVVIPNGDAEAVRQIAAQYAVEYLVLQVGGMTDEIALLYDDPPAFLTPIPLTTPDVRLYAFTISP